MNRSQILKIAEEHSFLVNRFFDRCAEDVSRVATRIVRCVQQGGKILLFGNGGSAADAQHIAAELTGRFEKDRPAVAAIALTCDTSALTAIANDTGFEQIFSRQIEALGRKGDLAIAISTSGQSPNVIQGVRTAREHDIETIGLLGREGGELRAMVDHAIVVGAQKTSRIQEIHILLGHILCEAVETELFQPR
ncbi:MAG: D-sedoheptulose 7-phosphate isomerase [Acidobacteriota bacterium]|nr:D-sedoheptulose 7-phosphate isomerase [Acidobacteriota bacterium]MDQ7086463.1 D-sedoheptulose 7-phosphate isomerase [Acidobacteriota bacterium]